MKHQIVVIHGGDNFETQEQYIAFLETFPIELDKFRKHKWNNRLGDDLGDGFDVLAPQMPNKWNAKYAEWKLWFDKITALLDDEVALIGHSLGGVFLARYLTEDTFPKRIRGTFLVAAPHHGSSDEPLLDFTPPRSLDAMAAQAGQIFLYHSTDDPVVPVVDLDAYRAALPQATGRLFNDRGHFGQSDFPELVADIKQLFSA